MSMHKHFLKSKFVSEDIKDFLNEPHFIKDSPKPKKTQKRKRAEASESIASTIGQVQSNTKNMKSDNNFEVCIGSKQKLFDVMSRQLESRKQTNDCLLRSLLEILTSLEVDHNALKENEQKLDNLTGAFMKCIQQSTSAHKQKLKALNEIHTSFKKECEAIELIHKAETDQLANELEDDMKKLQQKLVSETKKRGWETLGRTILQAMQNDF